MREFRRWVRLAGALAVCVTPFLVSNSASAHHSFAMFDASKQVTITGVVKNYQWSNPHVWIDVVAKDAKGEHVYGLESLAVGLLYRQGWTDKTIKPGDTVTAVLHPMRDGTYGGQLMTMKVPDGRTLNSSGAGTRGGNPTCIRIGGFSC